MPNVPLQPVSIVQTPQQRTGYTPALLSLGVLYFMMGFITCLNDTLVPYFKKGFTLSYTQSSFVQFYFFLTYAVMSVPAGRIVTRMGYRNGMVLGFTVAAAGALLFLPAALLHRYPFFLAALFVLAIGIVLLQVAANPYITVLGPPATASSRLALIQGVGAAGTTLAPLFGARFILGGLETAGTSSHAVIYPYIGIAALLLLIAITVFLLKLPAVTAEGTNAGITETPILSFRQLKWGIGGIFAYVGAEVAIGTFLTNYTADLLHVTEKAANSYVAFYWGSMLAGRLLGAAILHYVRPSGALTACAVAAAMLIIVSLSTSGPFAVITMICTGTCNAILFATIFSLSVQGLGTYTTRASGLLSTAIAGGAVIPLLQGYVRDISNWQVAFAIPLLCYAYLIFYGTNGYRPHSNGYRE